PEMVVTPGVEGCERTASFVVRLVADEVLAAGMRQLVDGTFEPEAGQLLRLARPRSGTGPPKAPLGLRDSELAPPHGHTGHARDNRHRSAAALSPIEGRGGALRREDARPGEGSSSSCRLLPV